MGLEFLKKTVTLSILPYTTVQSSQLLFASQQRTTVDQFCGDEISEFRPHWYEKNMKQFILDGMNSADFLKSNVFDGKRMYHSC